MDRVTPLLRGAIDIHIHPAPSHLPRSVDSWEALEQAAAAGMRGVLIKDHQFTTAPQAFIINKHAGVAGCRLYSSICLNNASGGLNPHAVEAAIRQGVDLVYLPTFSAQNHLDYMKRLPGSGHPPAVPPESVTGRQVGSLESLEHLEPEGLGLLDGDGVLKPVVKTIIDQIADADIILGTGHCSTTEMVEAVRYAVATGCRKILLTHLPAFTTDNPQELKRITDLGVCFVELCFEMTVRIMPAAFNYSYGQLADFARFFGVDRVVFSTDFGQKRLPTPVEGMKAMIRMLIGQGFDDEEIRTMTSRNPAWLLGIGEPA